MVDGLPAIRALVDDKPVAGVQALGLSDDLRRIQEMGVIPYCWQLGDASDLCLGGDHDMNRCLRVNVPKRKHVFVFVHDVRRDLP